MDQHEARRIAESAHALRPDWPIRQTLTILAEFRHMAPVDVHLAVVWIAYDPDIATPGALRDHTGPWWRITTEPETVGPALRTWTPVDDQVRLDEDRVRELAAAGREQLHEAREQDGER